MSEFGGPWAADPAGALGESRAALAEAVAALGAYLAATPDAPAGLASVHGQLTASLAELDRLAPESAEA